MQRSDIKVLMYHRLLNRKPAGDVNFHYVETEMFRKQMKLLDALNFTPVTFRDYALHLEEKLSLPDKPVILTFDDGYLDTYELAVPVLLELEMRGVIFVMGDRTAKSGYWDEVPGGEQSALMNDEQIRHLRSIGFEIGAHCMHHVALPDLSDTAIEAELAGARKSLEELLGERVDTVSYPYGRVDDRVQRIARDAGYRFGCGVYTGPGRFASNRYDIRRISIDQHISLAGFLFRLLAPYPKIESTLNNVRNVTASLLPGSGSGDRRLPESIY